MSIFRFSLRWLLAFVTFVAVAVASLRYASYQICSCWWAAWLLFLAATVLGAIYRARRERAFWLGCCVFGWTFAAHASIFPILEVKNSPLAYAIQSVYDSVSWTIVVDGEAALEHRELGGRALTGGPAVPASIWFPLEHPFKSTLVVMGGFSAAIIGGLVAQWFHATQDRKSGDARCDIDDQ